MPKSPKASAGLTAENEAHAERVHLELFKAVLQLKNLEECRNFFDDLCTPDELNSMSERWQVVKLLEKGLSYRKINEMTGVSTATITRVARCLTHGQGYKVIVGRVK